jgi:hypothetical protein
MDRELKEKIGILYTTTFLPDENSAAYVSFHNSFLTKYGIAPTEINLRGYDLGIYIMSMLDEYSKDKGKLNEFFKKHNSVKAIHANFDFQGQSDNQGVHIMQYVPGGTVKRNR